MGKESLDKFNFPLDLVVGPVDGTPKVEVSNPWLMYSGLMIASSVWGHTVLQTFEFLPLPMEYSLWA